MKSLKFAAIASLRLDEIVDYTIARFGWEQAEKYIDQLREGAQQLCDSPFPLGKPCPVLAHERPDTTLRYRLVGRHYFVFVETDDSIEVIDFVHVSRNLAAVIDALDAGVL